MATEENIFQPAPTTFEEAVEKMVTLIKGMENHSKWLKTPEDAAVVMTHHGLGMTTRNEWGLWSEDGPLLKNMQEMGFTHPDDMSSAILLCTHRKMNGKPLDVEGQIKYYKDYWARTGKGSPS